MTDELKIPGAAIDNAGTDVLGPLQKLLTGIDVLDTSESTTGGAFKSPSQAEAIIESGATALTKWWAGAVAALGGATAITAAITKFWSGQHGDVRVALLATTGGVIAFVAIALAIIVSSDVRGRAAGAVAIYQTRASVTSSMLELLCCLHAAPGGAPALTADAITSAANAGAKAAVSPFGDQLSSITQQLSGMDKRNALIALGAVQLQSAGKKPSVSSSVHGVTGEIQDVSVGPGPTSSTDVQVNIQDLSSGSLKAVPLDDVTVVEVR